MKQYTTTGLFSRWFRYVWKHKKYLIPALISVFLVMAADIFVPKIFGFIIDTMLTENAIADGYASIPLMGRTPLIKAFLLLLGILLLVLAIRSITMFARSVLLTLIGEKVHLDIRKELFEKLQRLPISYFDKNYTGKIMARLTTDTDMLWHVLFNGITSVLAPSLTVFAIFFILLRINVTLTVFTVITVPIAVYLFSTTRKKARAYSHQQREVLSDIYAKLQERISGVRTIRIFGREEIEIKSYMVELVDLYKKNMDLMRAWSGLSAKTNFLTGTATALILCLGGIAVYNGRITVGEMVQFYLYVTMLFAPLAMVTDASTRVFANGEVAMHRIFEILDMATAQELHGTNKDCPHLHGTLDVTDISFAYNPEETVLSGINLNIKAGETVAFVGSSGAGKTTMINLICRFYQPTGGIIKVDGHDINEFNVESYRKQISYVSQESFLFSGNILENIKFGKQDATREQIEYAAKLANAHDFIMKLPKGYESETGERGINLSGGQKQRINIARALLIDPSIIIMDEPTSALDAESESIILESLRTTFKNKTCLIIAHRLSTVMTVDNIFVFDEGKIVEQGRHNELAANKGLYSEFCKKQFLLFGGSSLDDSTERSIQS